MVYISSCARGQLSDGHVFFIPGGTSYKAETVRVLVANIDALQVIGVLVARSGTTAGKMQSFRKRS